MRRLSMIGWPEDPSPHARFRLQLLRAIGIASAAIASPTGGCGGKVVVDFVGDSGSGTGSGGGGGALSSTSATAGGVGGGATASSSAATQPFTCDVTVAPYEQLVYACTTETIRGG